MTSYQVLKDEEFINDMYILYVGRRELFGNIGWSWIRGVQYNI